MKLHSEGVYLINGTELVPESESTRVEQLTGRPANRAEARRGTISYGILKDHNLGTDMDRLRIRFDVLTSHDITYVGIIQTARASGMERFPMPYVLTCCHNSLNAVGGTINEDDHLFGLTAAQKYGGIFVPPHAAVIHQYMREMYAGCGRMILGSDSHTRYGALGTLAVGEGGGELDKQILGDTWDIAYPEIVAVYLTGRPQPFVGPHDLALAICKAVYKNGYVKNKIMEFVGPGVSSMPTDYRNCVDVMSTETTCLSSIWRTDDDTKAYLTEHGRAGDFRRLAPAPAAYYDACIEIDLSAIRPMIAMPFHPSNAFTIDELNGNLTDILRQTELAAAEVSQGRAAFTLLDKVKKGGLQVQQGIIAGCAGGSFSNVAEAAALLHGKSIGPGPFALSVYPASLPVLMDLTRKRMVSDLTAAGAIVKTAFCGPCFGAGDTPAHNTLSIRHTTRNFPNREGAKPGQGQMAAVALMDARSIAATALNGGIITSAERFADAFGDVPEYRFDRRPYSARVYFGFGMPKPEQELVCGPNIKDWPERPPLGDNLLLKVCSKLLDEVTTTDELIPSGETSSYRSNPLGLAEYTLSRRDPSYVGRAKEAGRLESIREEGGDPALADAGLKDALRVIRGMAGLESLTSADVEIGSVIYARRPGDGSAREQAASCQRVLGGLANIAQEYATKRYRSNVMNWGMLPFQMKGEPDAIEVDDFIFVPSVKAALAAKPFTDIPAYVIRNGRAVRISLYLAEMTQQEKEIVAAGCLINYNRNRVRSEPEGSARQINYVSTRNEDPNLVEIIEDYIEQA